ncbi:helix-turn-helix domain-containing protein [Deinococcus enclensis]|uniref:helix-turn-helix domain-containing protein n=1 Tax=Deinococcus enclensis TaxID=1049582 RepID=UPI00351C49A1
MVGSQIRQARLNRVPQWSLEELSQHLYQVAQLELGPSTLSKIETGVRSIYDFEIYALAKTLEVSLDWLFKLPEIENNDIKLEGF